MPCPPGTHAPVARQENGEAGARLRRGQSESRSSDRSGDRYVGDGRAGTARCFGHVARRRDTRDHEQGQRSRHLSRRRQDRPARRSQAAALSLRAAKVTAIGPGKSRASTPCRHRLHGRRRYPPSRGNLRRFPAQPVTIACRGRASTSTPESGATTVEPATGSPTPRETPARRRPLRSARAGDVPGFGYALAATARGSPRSGAGGVQARPASPRWTAPSPQGDRPRRPGIDSMARTHPASPISCVSARLVANVPAIDDTRQPNSDTETRRCTNVMRGRKATGTGRST